MPYFYVLSALAMRFMPHPWNMTPLSAMFLYSGTVFKSKSQSILVPLISLMVSDMAVTELLHGRHYDITLGLASLLAFTLIAILGWTLRRHFGWGRLIVASIAGSMLFFTITNFAEWLQGHLYPMTGAGLMHCYLAGVPFFSNSLAGDLLYALILFGAHRWFNAPTRPDFMMKEATT